MISLLFLLTSLGLVVGSIVLGGTPAAFWSASAALLVIAGALCVTAATVRPADWRVLRRAVRVRDEAQSVDPARMARLMLDLASRVRREGPIVLESARSAARRNPILDRALLLVIDGCTPDSIERLLHAEAQVRAADTLKLAATLRRAADIAPAMGLIGTLIGLVQMMGTLTDADQLGPAMAVALLTTLYGALLAYVVLGPLAAQVEARASEGLAVRALAAAGAAALARGEHPLRMEAELNAFLPADAQVRAA